MQTVYLALGSNLGDRRQYLTDAVAQLAVHPQILLTRVSSILETAPVGYRHQPDFLNAVVEIQTTFAPADLLTVCQGIEQQAGRVRNPDNRNAPRTLDIDILLYGDWQVATETLTIPHPRMRERDFVMTPLREIAPHLVVPAERALPLP